jgi:hypothetical protein
VATLIGLVLAVALCEIALRIAMPHWREFYSGRFMQEAYVPGYGFVMGGRPGFDGQFAQNNGDFRVRLKLNAIGLRESEPPEAADGRIWVVGDSMAFGWGVEYDETYAKVLERAISRPVYSVTSPGADICGYQAMIARMPPNVRPDAVVVGLILENDVRKYDCPHGGASATPPRALNVRESWSWPPSLVQVKYTLTEHSALYNFFAVVVKRIGVLNEFLVAIGVVEREHRVRNRPDGAAVEALVHSTSGELAAIRKQLPDGIPFAVLIAPARFDIRSGDKVFRRMRLAFVRELGVLGIDAIDPFSAFAKAGFRPTHFPHDGHWSPLGHRLAGQGIAAWMKMRLN